MHQIDRNIFEIIEIVALTHFLINETQPAPLCYLLCQWQQFLTSAYFYELLNVFPLTLYTQYFVTVELGNVERCG